MQPRGLFELGTASVSGSDIGGPWKVLGSVVKQTTSICSILHDFVVFALIYWAGVRIQGISLESLQRERKTRNMEGHAQKLPLANIFGRRADKDASFIDSQI
ncbi:hypothetical protein SDJN02_07363, partial [Cucurbita argyrosperma subsp. argyrosperma]